MTDSMNVAGLGSMMPLQPQRLDANTNVTGVDGNFRDILIQTIEQVNQLQKDADIAVNTLETGQTERIAEVLAASRKAELAFRTLMQVHSRILSAYEDINRMQF